MGKDNTEKKNFIAQSVDFSRESVAELKKVYHPTREETINLTVRVFGMIFMFSVFLGLTDFFVGWMMQNILT